MADRRDVLISSLFGLCGLLTWSAAGPARAALDIGERVPNFSLSAVQAGKPFTFSLADTLAKGPVVVYFFPVAFSEGCSIEANLFAEAIPEFDALGATVLGVSGDEIEVLSRFSMQVCNGRFPVASDRSQAVMKSFDAQMKTRPEFANRVSYVIGPTGQVVASYISLNPARHVDKMLTALREWKKGAGR